MTIRLAPFAEKGAVARVLRPRAAARPRRPRASWPRCPSGWSRCCNRGWRSTASQVRLAGHFSGKLGDVQGKGQAIDFTAIDILRVRDGKVTDNWHLEDKLGFMQQAGLLAK